MGRLAWTRWVTLALAALVVGTAYLYKLGGTPLWGDEAGTGLFARNVLQFGYPIGFDGRNLSIYDGGAELNADLVVAKIPWLQFYVGALSLSIFGDDAEGLRTLFAVLGVVALFPLWAVLRSRVPLPLFVATLILVTPQVVLFHRNARYYSALTLTFAVLVWVVCTDTLSRGRRLALACVCMVLMFHAHSVAALACAGALLLHAGWRKQHFQAYLAACSVGAASWLLWTASVGPSLVAPQLFMDFQGRPPVEWPATVSRNLWVALIDMDAVQAMPLLAWALCLGLVWKTRRQALVEWAKDPLVSFVVLALAMHTLMVALLFGTETSEEHSLLRYMPHLITISIVPLYMLLAKGVKDARCFAVLCVAFAATNVLSISFWSDRAGQDIPVSWWPATYQEILSPQPQALHIAMYRVRQEASVNHDSTETVLAIPSWLQEVAIFYLGDKFIVVPNLEPGSAAENMVRRKIGQDALARFGHPPKWVVYAAQDAPASVPGYERAVIQTHHLRPDDGRRPELTRHTFYQPHAMGHISLYRRLE